MGDVPFKTHHITIFNLKFTSNPRIFIRRWLDRCKLRKYNLKSSSVRYKSPFFISWMVVSNPWGYPCSSSISSWDFPWNQPSSYWMLLGYPHDYMETPKNHQFSSHVRSPGWPRTRRTLSSAARRRRRGGVFFRTRGGAPWTLRVGANNSREIQTMGKWWNMCGFHGISWDL